MDTESGHSCSAMTSCAAGGSVLHRPRPNSSELTYGHSQERAAAACCSRACGGTGGDTAGSSGLPKGLHVCRQ